MENASKALIIAGAILIAILLITIGIILITSGQEITETGNSQMNSQNIRTFNSQFTAYEGTIKGSAVKSLISLVNANNITNDGCHVAIYTDIAKNVAIKSTANYKVQIHINGDDSVNDTDCTELYAGKTDATTKGFVDKIYVNEQP